MTAPLISIVIPVYNAERYLRPAIESMLAQTFTDWEMICLNDGSTDTSGKILEELALSNPRMRVIHQENQGVTATLNRGLSLAVAPLVARMDADDISMPDRLAKQLAFLGDHPNHVAVGGAILKIDTDADRLGVDCLRFITKISNERCLSVALACFIPRCCIVARLSKRWGAIVQNMWRWRTMTSGYAWRSMVAWAISRMFCYVIDCIRAVRAGNALPRSART